MYSISFENKSMIRLLGKKYSWDLLMLKVSVALIEKSDVFLHKTAINEDEK